MSMRAYDAPILFLFERKREQKHVCVEKRICRKVHFSLSASNYTDFVVHYGPYGQWCAVCAHMDAKYYCNYASSI